MKVLVFAALVAAATAVSQYKPTPAYKPAYPAPAYPAPAYPAPAYPSYEPATPYQFDYLVKDEPTYKDHSAQESSDGKVVSGSYKVLLPDGRTQVVTYKVEGNSGLVAETRIEGAAYKADYKPAYPAYPAPKY